MATKPPSRLIFIVELLNYWSIDHNILRISSSKVGNPTGWWQRFRYKFVNNPHEQI